MRKIASSWKILVAILSLLLTFLIWQRGLQESFERPSVSPKLNVSQREMAFLAAPSLPKSFRPLLVGKDPRLELKKVLLQLDSSQIGNREKILLATLEASEEKRSSFLAEEFEEPSLERIRKNLIRGFQQKNDIQKTIENLRSITTDPLLYRLSCLAISTESDICFDSNISRQMAFRLTFSQLIPLFATLIGIFLLILQGWIYLRRQNIPWPDINFLPLSTLDMVILVAGGFVVLGEVFTPVISLPIGDFLTRGVESPIKESLKVFVGYAGMTFPPLLILRKQLSNLSLNQFFVTLFQWDGVGKLPKSLFAAFKGWLMVMPFVLLVSWLTTYIFGDPGGSNPLLEMVLDSKNFWALAVLFVTTVFMAPLFEELVFRGALLPVLVKEQGKIFAVVVSGLIFALAHLSVGETPPLFTLGIGLALLRLSTGRLLPCIFMHSLWNGITFLNLVVLSS